MLKQRSKETGNVLQSSAKLISICVAKLEEKKIDNKEPTPKLAGKQPKEKKTNVIKSVDYRQEGDSQVTRNLQ